MSRKFGLQNDSSSDDDTVKTYKSSAKRNDDVIKCCAVQQIGTGERDRKKRSNKILDSSSESKSDNDNAKFNNLDSCSESGFFNLKSSSSGSAHNLWREKFNSFINNEESSNLVQHCNVVEVADAHHNLVDEMDYRPNFTKPFSQEDAPLSLDDKNSDIKVNRYIARYLLPHQVVGVKWLWSKYSKRQGAILGYVLKTYSLPIQYSV